MTLDKTIEVYEFWANAHERDAEYHRPLGCSHESIANVAEGQAREERQIAEWLKELKAYRETYPYGVEGYPPRAEPNYSEKPNNCEDLQDWKDRMWAEAIVTEPTISKMEQVDKDINVRSKDEPQNGYVLSKDSDAYKFNKRMEVEEMWLNEQSGKEQAR